MRTSLRQNSGVAVAAFAGGLFIAVVVVVLWFMVTSSSGEPPEIAANGARDTLRTDGLITHTANDVEARMQAERRVVRPVRGNLHFRALDVQWTDAGRPAFVDAPELQGEIDTRAAGRGDIIIRGLAVNGGDVYVEENARKEWNYQRVMAPLFEQSSSNVAARVFVVHDVAIRNVRVRVRMPDRSFEFRDVAAQLPVAEFSGPHLAAPRVAIARATAVLAAADSLYPFSATDAHLTFPTGRVDFTVAGLQTGATRLAALSGTWSGDLPGYGLRMDGTVQNLRFQDVRFASRRLPASGSAAFGFHIEPTASGLTRVALNAATMESQGSRANGSATVVFGDGTMAIEAIDAHFDPIALSLVEQMTGDTLPFKGSISGSARGTGGLVTFDVISHLADRTGGEPFDTHLIGTAKLASSGFQLRHLELNFKDTPLAALRALMPSLPFKGTLNGRVTLNGAPGTTPLVVNLRVGVAGGAALVAGTIDLTGAVPTYDLTGHLLAVNLQQLLQPSAPPAYITAHFSAVGSGFDPAIAHTRLHIEGHFTGWQTGAHDTIHVAARIQNGTLLVDSAAVKLASMNASASGRWHFVSPASGAVSYRVSFEPITPFGPYIPAIGNDEASGSLALDGNVTGERGDMHFAGSANATSLAIGAWAAGSLDGKYQLSIGPAIPQFNVQLDARDVRTPTAGAYQTASASIKLRSPAFALDVHANRTGNNGGIEIVADGSIPPSGAREVVLHTARIDLGNDNWSLSGPAVFSWAGPGADLNVRGFEMRRSDGTGLLKLEGRVLPLANADFKLETAELPIGDIQRLLGRQPQISGALSTATTIRTVAGVPQLNMTFRLDSAIVEDVRFSQLNGDATYTAQHLVANATAVVDTAGALQLHADLPVELRLGANGGARMLQSGPVRVTLISDSIALAPFAALSPEIQKLSGALAANLTVTGTVQDPVMNGSVSVRNGAMTVVPANQHFDSINAVVTFENRTARIQSLVARAVGRVNATGNVEFRDLTKPVLDLTADLDRFQAVGVDNEPDAQISGRVHLSGPLSEAVLTGDLTMAEGYFPIPQVGSSTADAELAQYDPDAAVPGAQTAPSLFSNISIAGLRLTIGPNLWFTMPDARAELGGILHVDKNGQDISITGDLEGERGQYVLRAGPIIRRFDVTHALVRFQSGTEINPSIDVTAERTVVLSSGRDMVVQVHVGGTMQSPTLSLASQDAAMIPQSELLSFLLFGEPSFALSNTGSVIPGQQVIEQTLAGGLNELASIALEQQLLDQLGMSFDIFQIRLGGARLNDLSPSLVVGREVGTNVFLTVETAVNTLFGGTERTAATFAVHLEWRINENTTVRTSYEPANKNSVLRGYLVALPTALQPAQRYQGTLEFRRRWTW